MVTRNANPSALYRNQHPQNRETGSQNRKTPSQKGCSEPKETSSPVVPRSAPFLGGGLGGQWMGVTPLCQLWDPLFPTSGISALVHLRPLVGAFLEGPLNSPRALTGACPLHNGPFSDLTLWFKMITGRKKLFSNYFRGLYRKIL